jgi:hypothetical protein
LFVFPLPPQTDTQPNTQHLSSADIQLFQPDIGGLEVAGLTSGGLGENHSINKLEATVNWPGIVLLEHIDSEDISDSASLLLLKPQIQIGRELGLPFSGGSSLRLPSIALSGFIPLRPLVYSSHFVAIPELPLSGFACGLACPSCLLASHLMKLLMITRIHWTIS